jgi:hypothetical protein
MLFISLRIGCSLGLLCLLANWSMRVSLVINALSSVASLTGITSRLSFKSRQSTTNSNVHEYRGSDISKRLTSHCPRSLLPDTVFNMRALSLVVGLSSSLVCKMTDLYSSLRPDPAFSPYILNYLLKLQSIRIKLEVNFNYTFCDIFDHVIDSSLLVKNDLHINVTTPIMSYNAIVNIHHRIIPFNIYISFDRTLCFNKFNLSFVIGFQRVSKSTSTFR